MCLFVFNLQTTDDYFLSNVKTVDEITQERKRRLLSTTKWQQNVVLAFSTWPCLNIIKDFTSAESKDKNCSGCHREKIFSRIFLYGQPYNESTLDSLYIHQPSPQDPQEKVFLINLFIHIIYNIKFIYLFIIYSFRNFIYAEFVIKKPDYLIKLHIKNI